MGTVQAKTVYYQQDGQVLLTVRGEEKKRIGETWPIRGTGI